LVSLICSGAAEFLEALLRFRARDLEHGIRELLQNPDTVKAIYDHPLVNSLYDGTYGVPGPTKYTWVEKMAMRKRRLPSYIPARNFALALLETIGGKNAVTGTVAAPPAVPPAAALLAARPSISLPGAAPANVSADAFKAVSTLVAAAQNDAAKARENVEEWFNSGMDRVSGWYKRRTQYILLVTGLLAAVAFNLDSIGVAKALAANKSLRDGVVQEAMKAAKETPPGNAAAPLGKTDGRPKPAAEAADTGTTAAATAATTATATTTATTETTTAATETTATTATPTPPSTTTDAMALAKQSAAKLQKQIAVLNSSGLPLGWHNPFLPRPEGWGIVTKILGLLITACAVSLGAPFWFDMLNKIIVVRSTVKPSEKSGTEGSKEPKA